MAKKIPMTCTCCGNALPIKYEQWWNQDRGTSLDAKCAKWIQEREGFPDGEMIRRYGEEGIHREPVEKEKAHTN